MTPEQILFQLQNPHNYTGKEINRSRKLFLSSGINVCLVFPDLYEIGMSHQGIKLLYQLLNKLPNVNAERCFLPDTQSLAVFREMHLPLFSLESRSALNSFDIVAFSMLSELNFTNLLAVLDYSNIPLFSEERTNFPLIAAGGISIINPEPLRQFVDLFAFGDGEVLFPDIVSLAARAKNKNQNKTDLLNELDQLPGCYVPCIHPLEKVGPYLIPNTKGKTVVKQHQKKLSIHDNSSGGIVPLGQVVFDRLDIEVARGCPNACRFCQARNYYAPFRYKSATAILDQIESNLKSTGFDTLSLASLSTGDHPDLPLIVSGIDSVLPQCTAFSFPSLRPRTLTDQMLKAVSKYRRTGLTIVPEAGSERLRRVIGKEVTDQEILAAVENAIKNSWQKIKLYFMIGLPTETDDDILAIADLITEIQRIAHSHKSKIDLTISFSTFVPKPHTPFQWAPRLSISESKRRINLIKANVNKTKHVKFDFHSLEKGLVETILARGDMQVGRLIFEAYKAGELFTAWDNGFHSDIWLDLIDKLQLSLFLEELPSHTALPWSFIIINQTHNVLAQEYRAAHSDLPQDSCFPKNCPTCGLCLSAQDQKSTTPSLRGEQDQKSDIAPTGIGNSCKVRIFYQKKGDFRFFPHLAMQKYIERIIRISALPFAYSEGFHPRIKMAMLPPLPVFAQSLNECIELFLAADLHCEEILLKLNAVESSLKFYRVTKPHPQSASLTKDLHTISFSFAGPVSADQIEVLKEELQKDEALSVDENLLTWTLSSRQDISAQFGKTYRILDPERLLTRHLSRESITFHSDPPTEESA